MEGYSQAREVRPLGASQPKKAPAMETIGKRMTRRYAGRFAERLARLRHGRAELRNNGACEPDTNATD
jgi:hypothetical protein